MPFHGEAGRTSFGILAISPATPAQGVTLRGSLPLAQETATRTVELVDGENVMYVTTQLDDVTLADGKVTIVDHSGKRAVLAASKGFRDYVRRRTTINSHGLCE